MTKQPIIEEIIEEGHVFTAQESIIGDSVVSSITIRPEQMAEKMRNALVASGEFDSVRYNGNNDLEINLYGKWYVVSVSESLRNLFI